MATLAGDILQVIVARRRAALFVVVLALGASSCASDSATGVAATAPAASSDVGPSAVTSVEVRADPNYRPPQNVAEVEQRILAYGDCVVGKVNGIGLAVRFDRETGRGGAFKVAPADRDLPDSEQLLLLDAADVAQATCDGLTMFNQSLIDFSELHPVPQETLAQRVKKALTCIDEQDLSYGELLRESGPTTLSDLQESIARLPSNSVDGASSALRCVEQADGGEWLVFGDDSTLLLSDPAAG